MKAAGTIRTKGIYNKTAETQHNFLSNRKLLCNFSILLRNRNLMIALTAVLTIVIVCLSVSSVAFANSKIEEKSYKYYTSIEIKPGDSLWSIASEYCLDMDMSVNDYIREIKRLNHLSSDSITSGQYLTIMYVSNEYK